MIRIVIILAACALGLGIYENPGPVGLAVREVRVDRTRLVPDEWLAEVTHDFVGRPMSRQTCRGLRARLREHWAVERAQVTRVWPRALSVTLAERPVVARTIAPLAAIDREGRVMEHAGIPQALPLLAGWAGEPAWSPALPTLERIAAFPALWEGSVMTGPPRDGFAELDCPTMGARLMVPCPPDVHLDERLAFTLTILADVRARGERPGVIDLRWANQVIVSGIEE